MQQKKMGREEEDSVSELLRDRFRVSTISIAEAEAKRNDMEISGPVMTCIADLAFKFTVKVYSRVIQYPEKAELKLMEALQFCKTEQLAKDLELFAQHAGRKTANMEDVILSAHRNEHLAALLRSFSNDLKAREPQSERKRKKSSKKEDQATTSVISLLFNFLVTEMIGKYQNGKHYYGEAFAHTCPKFGERDITILLFPTNNATTRVITLSLGMSLLDGDSCYAAMPLPTKFFSQIWLLAGHAKQNSGYFSTGPTEKHLIHRPHTKRDRRYFQSQKDVSFLVRESAMKKSAVEFQSFFKG
ncbi:Histone superfamily protein [Prunus dulcis]|uniref:Histone superfamily protein n=1 Tax=Prunus dulcis TaxID=3755 RepID=A0A4Y1RIT0_PRUDU|nr:Histone superfamily protein [Prunus dulcis]